MDLLGRAFKMMKGAAPSVDAEPQPFRVECPEGHVIRGRRTEGYQALRCPECGEGVFVLPRSPLPMPPAPAARSDRDLPAAAAPDDAPIALADHVPDPVQEAADADWLEPVDPAEYGGQVPPAFDPVEAAVADLPATPRERPGAVPPPARRASPTGPARPSAPVAGRPGSTTRAAGPPPRSFAVARPTLRARARRNRPLLVSLAVLGVLLGTVAWSIFRNQRRDAPALVQQGRDEGIAALDRGEFDRAYRILAPAASAVESLGGQIGGAEEVRQAAREAAIFVDLIPDPLEEILDQRARSQDEADWQRRFDRSYKGRSILISARIAGTPETSAGRYELNYKILAVGPLAPRAARIAFEGFRLFEVGPPREGSQVQFGARLAAIESEGDGWRFRLQPDSGVTITHLEALRALGWGPVETASLPPAGPGLPPASPLLLATLLTPPAPQDLRGETQDQILQKLGAPASYARSASQGSSIEQWIYPGPAGAAQYLNFVRSLGRSGVPVVDRDFYLR